MDQNTKDQVVIFDTTLRDAEQTPGCSLTTREKLEIAHQLARLNVDVIEAGFPVSSNEDFEAVKRIANEVEGPRICGLARAVRLDIERAGEALAFAEGVQGSNGTSILGLRLCQVPSSGGVRAEVHQRPCPRRAWDCHGTGVHSSAD